MCRRMRTEYLRDYSMMVLNCAVLWRRCIPKQNRGGWCGCELQCPRNQRHVPFVYMSDVTCIEKGDFLYMRVTSCIVNVHFLHMICKCYRPAKSRMADSRIPVDSQSSDDTVLGTELEKLDWVTVVLKNVDTLMVHVLSACFFTNTLKFATISDETVTPKPLLPQSQLFEILLLRLCSVEIKPDALSIVFIGMLFVANHSMILVHTLS